jgi:ATP-dependent exoDNAse (exonuclease V) alpha subunit
VNNINFILKELKNNNIFLTGGAGVGKSYTTNKIITHYRETEKKGVVALGSTGVSAVNIGGLTIHSFFAFGISNNFEELELNDKRNRSRLSELRKILQATDLIIIDEISMVSADVMDMISYRLNTLRYRGKLLFVGDFYQLPPIQRVNQKNINLFSNRLFAFESDSWREFNPTVLELTKMMRTTDIEFTHILHKIRIGECDREVIDYIKSLSQNIIKEPNPTYLFGRNLEVNHMNSMKLNLVNAKEHIFVSLLEEHKRISPKKLSTWRKSLPIEDKLVLKEGVPILFTINKWGKYANGERGIVRQIEDDYIIVEKDDEFIKVERYNFDLLDIKGSKNGKIENIKLATISQFPIKLAYAVTIHKSQGMSIDNIVCNVNNIFAPSQFYVAISRAINPCNLRIEFNRGDLTNYLYKMVRIDNRVKEYYMGI